MYKAAGTGLIGLGLVFVTIGAILKYAVYGALSGFNINTTGLILLVVGIGAFVVGLVAFVIASYRKTTVSEIARNLPGGGRERIYQEHESPIL